MKNRKLKLFKASMVATTFAVTLLSSAPLPLRAQTKETTELTNLKKIQNMQIDSLQKGIKVYYSKGYQKRATEMADRAVRDLQFYKDSLGIALTITLGLLDRHGYTRTAISGPPYGMPFEDDETGLIMMPADHTGAVIDAYAPFKNNVPKSIIDNLKKEGFTYTDAVSNMVDLIALHEIGHLASTQYGIKAKQPWFNEFLATYFGYAYMQYREPKMAAIWNIVTHSGYIGYTPKYKSLDELNKLYFGVGSDNYVWYQNAFQERIREVFAKRGLNFLRIVQARLSDPNFKPASANELLMELEKIEPGFLTWAETLTK